MLFRHSMCNEAFGARPFAEACAGIRRAGYTGIEIAPFTLAEDPASLTGAARREYAAIMLSEGLQFAGLHWLLAVPADLHVTAPDAALRARSWNYVRELIDLCAELGSGGVMVFGSPRQRSATGGLTPQEATRYLVQGLASVGNHAAGRGVTILLEALPSNQGDVVRTLGEAVAIVREIGSPAVRTMFDVHNTLDETEPHAALLDRYFDDIRHVHVNELDGRHCGTGTYDFMPLFEVLRRRSYAGWISLEVFDFAPGAERIAEESLRHLERLIAELPS
jgi:sugar phosphate isomerase/epimerase